jgi:hypothetical protein
MKKQSAALFLCLLAFVFSSLQLQAKEKETPLIGEWLYEVSEAPYGYEKGSLIFSKKDGLTVCTVKLEAGELEVSNLKVKMDTITFTAFVDGNPVNVELIKEKDQLTGKVDSPEGPKSMTAVKKKE